MITSPLRLSLVYLAGVLIASGCLPEETPIADSQQVNCVIPSFSSSENFEQELSRLESSGCRTSELYLKLGQLRSSRRDFEKASEYLTKSLAIKPNKEAYFLRARAYYELQDFQRAILDYEKFLSLFGDLTEHYNNLRENSPFESPASSEVWVSDGQVSEALNNAGYSALYLEQYSQAKYYFSRLLELERESIFARLGLAQTFYYWNCEGCQEKAVSNAKVVAEAPGASAMYGEILRPILEMESNGLPKPN